MAVDAGLWPPRFPRFIGQFGMGVWLSAIVGMALKLSLPGRFDRLAIILCLLLGWSGVIAYDSLASAIPSYGFSRSGASSTRSARFFMSGSACAFKTRSGMVLSCSRQVAIIPLCSPACSRYKRRDAIESISHICRRHEAARLDPPLAVGRGPKTPTLLDAFTHILIVIRPIEVV